jgi:hypothetical protein
MSPCSGRKRPDRRASGRSRWRSACRCSRDVIEVLRQRPLDRRLEEAGQHRMDDLRAVRGEERADLLLSAQGNLNSTGWLEL